MGADISTIVKANSLSKDNEAHKNLDASKMLPEACWLNYCFCRGVAIGDFGNPFFGEESKMLCMHSTCELAPVGGPFCQNNVVNICVTSQCQFPKQEASPTCVCFNKPLAGEIPKGTAWKQSLFQYDYNFDDQFWLYYFCCGGLACHKPNVPDDETKRPLFAQVQKQLCIKKQVKLVKPISANGNMCSGVGTNLCFWSHCEFPCTENATETASGNKKLGGFKLCGFPKGEKSGGPLSYGKPKQEEMQ